MEKSSGDHTRECKKDAELKLNQLQGQIEHLKQKIKLAESAERAETEEVHEKLKQNRLSIKKFKMKIEELKVCIKRRRMSDEKIIAKAFNKYGRDPSVLKNKVGSEVVEALDGKLFELVKKSDALSNEMQINEEILIDKKNQYQEMVHKCQEEFETRPTECDSLQRVRELENEYQKVQKNIEECEYLQSRYKEMQRQMNKDLFQCGPMLVEVENEYRLQQDEIKELMEKEEKAQDMKERTRQELSDIEIKALRTRQEKEKVIADFTNEIDIKPILESDVKLKSQKTSLDKRVSAEYGYSRKSDHEDLKILEDTFEEIKQATGVTDIRDIETKFLNQKSTEETLVDMKKRAQAALSELREDKKLLDSKMKAMRGAELACPQVVLEEEIKEATHRNEEQMLRKITAEAELERITQLLADIKTGLWNQLQMIQNYIEEDQRMEMSPNFEADDLARKIEAILGSVISELKNHDLNEVLKRIKEDKVFQRAETLKIPEVPIGERKLKATAEEESSDDDDTKKRALLKKEAENFAEIKKKQKGRGKILML